MRLHNFLLCPVFTHHLGHLSLSCCLSATGPSPSNTPDGQKPAERKADSEVKIWLQLNRLTVYRLGGYNHVILSFKRKTLSVSQNEAS